MHGLMRPSMAPLPGLAGFLEPGACALQQAHFMVMEAGGYAAWTGSTTQARATRLGASIATYDQPRECEVPRHWAKPRWLGNVGNPLKIKPAGKRELMGRFQHVSRVRSDCSNCSKMRSRCQCGSFKLGSLGT